MALKIVFLDDERIFFDVYIKALTKLKIPKRDLLATANPAIALTWLKKHADKPCVFVSDYNLVGVNTFGDKVIKQAREQHPELPCILMSQEDDQDKAIAVGAHYWRKCRFYDDLAKIILDMAAMVQN